MAKTAKRLFGPALLSNTTATKYTVPASTKTVIRHVHVSNVTGTAATLTASIGADAAGTQLFTAKSIAPNDQYDWYGFVVMDAAEILAAHSGTNNALNMSVYGEEITLG